MKLQSCSMHLFREGEEKTAELGRKRYEELKKNLEERGLVGIGAWRDGMLAVSISDTRFWPLWLPESNYLDYNPELLKAIAGQMPEGGVGTIWKFNHAAFFVRILKDEDGCYLLADIEDEAISRRWYKAKEVELECHLATIEELIEAFPPTENAQVEPEPRKIRNPDAQEIIEDAIKELQELLPVYVNEWVDSSEDEYRTAVEDTKAELFKKWIRRHEQAGEEWINEVINGASEGIKPDDGIKEPRKIKRGMTLISQVDIKGKLSKGKSYVTQSDGYFIPNCSEAHSELVEIEDDRGRMKTMRVSCFTIANEEEPVKESPKYIERTHIAMEVVGGLLELVIDEEGVYTPIRDNETTDVTDFLRYALQRHDQLKQQ